MEADSELAIVAAGIVAAHEAAVAAGSSALAHARDAGELLTRAKAAVPHGAWLPWLAQHCPSIPERTAQAYMRIARLWPALEAKAPRVADLPLRQALALLDEPKPSPTDVATEAIDLAAIRAALDDEERRAASAHAELRALGRALEAPDLTIEEANAIQQRADQIHGDAFALRMRALADTGHLLQRAEADFGTPLADLIARDPEAVRLACAQRLASGSLQGEL